jgi:hypothetical protein
MNRNLAFYGIVVFFFTSSSFCSSQEFTKNQRRQVIQAVDNTCADSWCEGDYDYEFLDFVCNRTGDTCDLIFQFISVDDEVEKRSPPQTCHFINIAKLEQVLDDNKRLKMDFYDSLDSCISNLEDAFDKT